MKSCSNRSFFLMINSRHSQLLQGMLIVCCVLFLLSCQQNSSSNRANKEKEKATQVVGFDLQQIQQRGTLIALVDNSSTSYFIYKGQPMGYEYELLSRFAEELGVKLQLKVVNDIEDAFEMLNNGQGDILAYNLTVTKERKKQVAFTKHHALSRQVLVQRKPVNWRTLKRHEIEQALLRDPIKLIDKEVWVRKGSAHVNRLRNLSEEIGGEISIQLSPAHVSMEGLIAQVASRQIDYAVADENVALVNATYYPQLDVKTPVSFSQRIAWAVRINAPELLAATNNWITKMRKRTDYYVIYNKYFKNSKAFRRRANSRYFSRNTNKLSPYDDLVKAYADSLGWDWRLLAAQMYQESRFDPEAESWAGAKGLMQLMPETGGMFDAKNLLDPGDNIQAAVKYLDWLDKIWSNRIKDPQERMKFVLASYNVGQGHVIDAVKLAEKYGKDPTLWEDNVREFLLKKSSEQFYKDPVVVSGYCRGYEPVNYVDEIMSRYQQYASLIPQKDEDEMVLSSIEK
jgi:membrane-bound lytic murein transglycosylase F